ncbi:MAG: hypothetical protein R3F59_18095, partial [Myxococcota bacterium]
DAYYDERERVSTDYVAFARHVLDHYADRMTERDVQLLALAQKMNLDRLDQLPDERARAHDRKREQDQARAAWQSTRPGGPTAADGG